jgi:nucleoside-diphosphate-sugar epimerase
MKKLVIGASGFLGSHVTRQLVAQGASSANVRVMLRRTSSTMGIDDLGVERCYGDVFDDDALRAAMTGCDVVYYCVVDARMWLRDPEPLFRTNVEGLRHVLDAALDANLKRFVFTSTIGALAISDSRLVTEDDPHNWDEGGAYIEARVAAEEMVLSYAHDKGLPAVAMCVATTYGPRDWGPTPHGSMLAQVAAGRFPFYMNYSAEVVGIEDAARAMLLAAEHGRNGERYIISDRYMSVKELHEIAATAVGRRPPRIGISMPVLRAGAHINDVLARVLRRDLPFAYAGMEMVELMSPLDHSKAERELGWTPEPVEDSIRKAAVWFASRA